MIKIQENNNIPKNVRVTIVMSEELNSILDTMVNAYSSNMSSFINMLIMDKFTDEFLPFAKSLEEKNNM